MPKIAMPKNKTVPFKAVIKKVERPFSSNPQESLEWICETLGFLEPIDRGKTASALFKEILKSTQEGKRVSATELVERVGMSRGSVVNQLANLQRAGLIVKTGRGYSVRSKSVQRTIEEIEQDIARIFSQLKQAGAKIDEELGVVQKGAK